MISNVDRGFPPAEFEARVERAQALMAEEKLDGLFLTSGDNIRYFSGSFGGSNTRPCFMLVPAVGAPIAIVPALREGSMRDTWITDIRSWPSPCPEDDGTTSVVAALTELPRRFGRVAAEFGLEMRIGLPILQLNEIVKRLSGVELVDGSALLWALRMIKSDAEVAKIQRATDIAGAVFVQVPNFVHIGDSESTIHHRFRVRLLEEGASEASLTCRAGQGGPSYIAEGARNRQISDGDLLFIDAGAAYGDYVCDYNRNYQVGKASDALLFAHERIWDANEVGLRAAVPGVTAGHVFEEMAKVLSSGHRGELNKNGRMGHGLGLQVEPPSIKVGDNTLLKPGMVLCIEPALEYEPGKLIIHEETVVITDDGARLLTPARPKQLQQIS
ncbi:M24 family metallopeptidase [Sinorhizobium psoraleae]|uniref:Xaa-Pro peptidase family protein n=1 Tax=Sinorhizobium psoraleae TaxID=520838 RepID=A0ABT4KNY2_9HYPH|nr:Xaa-Pro peptidase family protein [Sinorhizobium psoraleae]MCZ4093683.1 Xaa-Pro peptidase family protein [Sinorhizobium psoraleae]